MENFGKYWKWIAGVIILILLFFWQGCDHVSSLFQKDEVVSLDNPLQDNQKNTALENAMAPVLIALGEIQKSILNIAEKKDTTIVICNCCPEKNTKASPSKPRVKAEKNQPKKSSKSPATMTASSDSDHQYSDGCSCWICTQIRNPCNNCKDAVDVDCDGDC